MGISKWKPLWCAVYWDAPTDTKEARAAERKFRRKIKNLAGGSFVGRIVRGTWFVIPKRREIAEGELLVALPPDGEMRIVPITDAQVEHSKNYWGERRKSPGITA